MTVASVDYTNKRIYLDSSTVSSDLDTLDVYREVRELRRTNEEHRKFKPMIVSGGNIQKTVTAYTQPYVQLLYGCRLVPYNTSHALRVVRETFTDDGFDGRDCFDRSSLSASVEVDIDYEVDKVEVRIVQTGGSALTTEEHNKLMALLGEERFKQLQFNRTNTVVEKRVTKYRPNNEFDVTVDYDADGVPTAEAIGG